MDNKDSDQADLILCWVHTCISEGTFYHVAAQHIERMASIVNSNNLLQAVTSGSILLAKLFITGQKS